MRNRMYDRLTGNYLLTLLALVVFLAGSFLTKGQDPSTENNPSLTVFLVRHAEKVTQAMDMKKDPALNAEGETRALQLAGVLRDAGIQYIHSTDYIRTRRTATPIASKLQLPIQTYAPKDLPSFADSLRKVGGCHLVVGHSNTTPALVRLLGGDPREPIDEKSEYDRLYIVTINPGYKVNTLLLRYGKLYGK